MVIWGSGYSVIHQEKIADACKVCKKHDLSLIVTQPRFEIFWIPTFPYRKEATVVCTNCQSLFPPVTYGIESIKARTPWWSFTGLVLFVLFLSIGVMLEITQTKALDAFKASPHANAYIIYKLDQKEMEDTPYVYAKVTKVKDGKVYLELGSYTSSNNRGAEKSLRSSKKDPAKYFVPGEQAMTLQEFQALNIYSLIEPEELD